MKRVVFTIEVELDYQEDEAAPLTPEYHNMKLTDNRVVDLVRDLFYNNTDRYESQIHASVNVRVEADRYAGN